MITPQQNSEFVAQLEDGLDIYSWEYNPVCPLVCMDGQPMQLVKETRQRLPCREGAPARYDFAYEENRMATAFLFTEPLAGWRRVHVRATRTKKDWAAQVKSLLDDDYPDAELVILICDNLNTHSFGALYDAFEPREAKRLAVRLDIRRTPIHGSWLNVAEMALSAITRQCLNRRIPDVDTLSRQTKTWAKQRTTKQTDVNWQFKTDDARI